MIKTGPETASILTSRIAPPVLLVSSSLPIVRVDTHVGDLLERHFHSIKSMTSYESHSPLASPLGMEPESVDRHILLAPGLFLTREAHARSAFSTGDFSLLPPEAKRNALMAMVEHVWLSSGAFFLHSALLRIQGYGILILAPRATGKSIVSAAALAAGGELISDDWLAVSRTQGGDAVLAERMRNFFLWRQSAAFGALLPSLRARGIEPHLGRLKWALRPEGDDPHFPPTARIDQVWVLRRPRFARSETSETVPLPATSVLHAVMEASMPSHWGPHFPNLRQQLMQTMNCLIRTTVRLSVCAGLDLVRTPAGTLSALIRAGEKLRSSR